MRSKFGDSRHFVGVCVNSFAVGTLTLGIISSAVRIVLLRFEVSLLRSGSSASSCERDLGEMKGFLKRAKPLKKVSVFLSQHVGARAVSS